MSRVVSPYYPPRARWYARIFYFSSALRRGIAMDRIYLPVEMTVPGVIGGFLVPGLAIYLREPRLWGKLALSACAILFLVFLLFLGYPLGNYAFGMMISLHATGFIYYCNPFIVDKSFRFRILFTILILMGMGFSLYGPLRNAIQNRWLMPLQINGRVVVIQKLPSADSIKRNDWVAYHLTRTFSNYENEDLRVYARSGMGYGPVLAVAGDQVNFSTNAFYVNGISHQLLPYMPNSGTFTVTENHWFIWPSYSISGEGNTGRIADIMWQMANVSEDQFVGKPFRRWFWREQKIP